MALSPNYGWTEPDNTGLVKNGAQDMRTLGDAIDTSVWNIGFGQAGKNKIINGNFGIWQRGTSFSYVGGQQYTADRWFLGSGALGRTVSRQSSGLTGFQYCARVQRDSGNTSTSIIKLMQALETVNSIPVAGQTVNLSFYARAGANYSTASSALSVRLVSGTGTDQNFDVGYTGSTDVVLTNVTLTTSWQRFTVTGTVGSTATELGIQFQSTPVGTAGAADFFEVTGVQLERGSKATPFQTASGGSLQGELAMCQRYFISNGQVITWQGNVTNAQLYINTVTFPVQMRVAPTITQTSYAASNFNTATLSAGTITVGGYLTNETANATASGAYYQLTYTASAEL